MGQSIQEMIKQNLWKTALGLSSFLNTSSQIYLAYSFLLFGSLLRNNKKMNKEIYNYIYIYIYIYIYKIYFPKQKQRNYLNRDITD